MKRATLALALFLCALPPCILAADEDPVLAQAVDAYTAKDYPLAGQLYEQLQKMEPENAEYLFMLAKCRIRTGQPAEALALIDRAVAKGGVYKAIAYERGRGLFLLEKYEESLVQFDEYHRVVPGNAYSFLAWTEALLAAERYGEALALLDKVEASPETSLHRELLYGAALAGLGRSDEAIARMEKRLEQQDLPLPERSSLNESLAFLKQPALGGRRSGKPWWVALTAGLEYDTNVPTLGKLPKPREPGFEETDAFRGSYTLEAGYRWEATDRLSVTAKLFGLAHTNDDLSGRDIALGRFSLNPEYQINDQVAVGVEGAYSHLFLNQATLTNSLGATGYATWRETSWTATRASYGYRWETFYDARVNTTEDLDGTIDTILVSQDFFVPETSLIFRLAYAHENSHTEGADFDYDSDALLGVVACTLPFAVRAQASYQHVHTTYHHPNFRDGFRDRRMNNTQIYGISLTREILPSLDLSASYTLTDAESNVKDFDFDRNVWGMSLTYRF